MEVSATANPSFSVSALPFCSHLSETHRKRSDHHLCLRLPLCINPTMVGWQVNPSKQTQYQRYPLQMLHWATNFLSNSTSDLQLSSFYCCLFILTGHMSLTVVKPFIFFDETQYTEEKMSNGLTTCPKAGATSVGFSSIAFFLLFFFFFLLSSLWWAEWVSTFTLGMFALKACCQKAGGREVEALLAEVLLPAAMNGSFRGEVHSGRQSRSLSNKREERWK